MTRPMGLWGGNAAAHDQWVRAWGHLLQLPVHWIWLKRSFVQVPRVPITICSLSHLSNKYMIYTIWYKTTVGLKLL